MRFLRSLLKNLGTLIASIIGALLFTLWYIDDGGWESFVGLVLAILALLGSAYNYIFYKPEKTPRIEIDIEGKTRKKDSGINSEGNLIRQAMAEVKYNY